jgi:hypothetical protein
MLTNDPVLVVLEAAGVRPWEQDRALSATIWQWPTPDREDGRYWVAIVSAGEAPLAPAIIRAVNTFEATRLAIRECVEPDGVAHGSGCPHADEEFGREGDDCTCGLLRLREALAAMEAPCDPS